MGNNTTKSSPKYCAIPQDEKRDIIMHDLESVCCLAVDKCTLVDRVRDVGIVWNEVVSRTWEQKQSPPTILDMIARQALDTRAFQQQFGTADDWYQIGMYMGICLAGIASVAASHECPKEEMYEIFAKIARKHNKRLWPDAVSSSPTATAATTSSTT